MVSDVPQKIGGGNQPDVRGKIPVEIIFGIGKPIDVQTIGYKDPNIKGKIVDFLFLSGNKSDL
jgi:hypothetical protein